MFPSRQESSGKLTETASFKQFLTMYSDRKELSENKLAQGARITQKRLNNISNNVTKSVKIPILVALCLVLELTMDEAKDLMARKERALSPANPDHRIYAELIELYSRRNTNYIENPEALKTALDEADEFLERNHAEELPNCYK